MTLNYEEYMEYELADGWCAEESSGNLILYNPSGVGAITISSFDFSAEEISMDEQISILAKHFIDNNKINVSSPLIIVNREKKTVLQGEGVTQDGWLVKIWVIAKSPKIILATYQSKKKSREIKVCDKIVDSIKLL